MPISSPVFTTSRGSTASAEPRWVVLYDADCGFCKWMLSGVLRWDRAARLRPVALQRPEANDLLDELTPQQRMRSWHLVSPAGVRRSGGETLPALLRLLPGGALPARGFALAQGPTNRGYRWIAEHRSQLSRWVPSRAKRHASEYVTRCEREREPEQDAAIAEAAPAA
jgi:predicted DCC family thiol-disulfide oxidoreductase YuxK